MLERKHKAILSLNLKKLANRVDAFLCVDFLNIAIDAFCKRVLKQRGGIRRYGKTTNNSFLGKVCSTFSVQITYLKIF